MFRAIRESNDVVRNVVTPNIVEQLLKDEVKALVDEQLEQIYMSWCDSRVFESRKRYSRIGMFWADPMHGRSSLCPLCLQEIGDDEDDDHLMCLRP